MEVKKPKWWRNKRNRWLLILGLFLCLIAGGYIYFIQRTPEVVSSDLLPAMEKNQDRSVKDVAQEVADANYFTLSINPNAHFSNGESEGTLQIINPESNSHPITVSVVLDETNEEVFMSKAIHPGQEIMQAKLSKNLPQGVYAATATVTIYDPETEEKQGATKAALTITIDN
ncbi:hypothetical protein [Candidatus Enterococcus murrayae]|uniref:Uncharacterized protein n=1 Tax=Candidatus Enterococcus murrayae TaxID=2815321 RepID=A0ABS3HHP5_9ENTE|nr:hypothetical protein [Enterococcus sp. MJM16]MBO0452976.1 hypothetical protein [Enterococcus sp. MJM16]